jgi:hypothetical protein
VDKERFVLAPLVFARKFTDPGSVAIALTAFVLFCVASSACYILNDIHDITATAAIRPSGTPASRCRAVSCRRRRALIACYGVLLVGLFWSPATMLAIPLYVVLNGSYLRAEPPACARPALHRRRLRAQAHAALALRCPCRADGDHHACLAFHLAAIKRQELANSGTEMRGAAHGSVG